jgi:hypothetical protein
VMIRTDAVTSCANLTGGGDGVMGLLSVFGVGFGVREGF